MLRQVLELLLAGTFLVATDDSTYLDDLALFRGAFTPAECSRIANLFLSIPGDQDVRVNPLLPNMDGDGFQVSRLNHFDDGTLMAQGNFDFIYSRLMSLAFGKRKMPPSIITISGHDWTDKSPEQFHKYIAFNLMHDFKVESAGRTQQFDWHADTKPGDGQRKVLNVNVMLSKPGDDFGGGELDVGAQHVDVRQGDMYVYPAALPHRVRPVLHGHRLTLVIALDCADCKSAENTSAPSPPNKDPELRSDEYWNYIGSRLDQLSNGSLARESKFHILHGEFLEAAGKAEEAQTSYCRAYVATGPDAAEAHVRQFFKDGMAALQQPDGPNIDLAQQYFSVARCIAPAYDNANKALSDMTEELAGDGRDHDGGEL